jgi:hypothetical protein
MLSGAGALAAAPPAAGLAARTVSEDSDTSFNVAAGIAGGGASGRLAMPRTHKK